MTRNKVYVLIITLVSPAIYFSVWIGISDQAYAQTAELKDESIVESAASEDVNTAENPRKRLLRRTDDDSIGWLVLDWMGTEAPIERWSEAMVVVGRESVTEFNRAERLKTAQDGLARERDAARGYTHMKISLNSTLSKYDAEYQEFYINAFSPGSFVTYRPFSWRKPNPLERGVRVVFSNAEDAFVLSMPAEEAKALVARVDTYYRQITVDIEVTIEEVNATGDGAEIIAKVDRYSLIANQGGAARALKSVILD